MIAEHEVLPVVNEYNANPPGFDYGDVAAEHRVAVRASTNAIKYHHGRAKEALLLIGYHLTEVKALLPHGQFEAWIKAEFDMSLRTAQRLMLVHERFGIKNDTVSLFSESVLYLLAAPSTPDEAVIAAEMQARAGQPVTKARAVEIIETHKAPTKPVEQPYVTVWAIEQMVKAWLKVRSEGGMTWHNILYFVGKLDPCLETDSLLEAAKTQLPGPYRKGDMIQAINNIRDQLRQDERQAELRASAKTVYVEPKPEPIVDSAPPKKEPFRGVDYLQAADMTPPDLAAEGYSIIPHPAGGGWAAATERGVVCVPMSVDRAIAYARQAVESRRQHDATPDQPTAAIAVDVEVVEAQPEPPAPEPTAPKHPADAYARWLRYRDTLTTAKSFRNVILTAIADMTGEHVAVLRAQRALDPLIESLERTLAHLKEE